MFHLVHRMHAYDKNVCLFVEFSKFLDHQKHINVLFSVFVKQEKENLSFILIYI